MKRCNGCGRRIFFWEARYSIWNCVEALHFHGECACDWLLDSLNLVLAKGDWRRWNRLP